MNIKRHNYEELGLPAGPYTHAVIHGDTLYTSGLTAFGTAAQNGSMSEQLHSIFDQLTFICDQNNTSLGNIIKVSVFVSDMTDLHGLRDTLFSIYGENVPASSLLKVEALFAEELKVEIEAIFAL